MNEIVENQKQIDDKQTQVSEQVCFICYVYY